MFMYTVSSTGRKRNMQLEQYVPATVLRFKESAGIIQIKCDLTTLMTCSITTMAVYVCDSVRVLTR